MERLDKLLASTGRWSRREVKELCRAGRVKVDGAVTKKSEIKVEEDAVLTVDGETVQQESEVWIMLHKPSGVVSATEDAREQTVLSLLPERYQRMGLFPVGRLDKDTEGLLLLTNNGAAAHELLSPRKHVNKVYYVEVDGVLNESDVQAFADGITLGDGTKCLPAQLRIFNENRGEVTLQEGKYHQVKRMLASRGKPVRYLKRVEFGGLKLDETLPRGSWRYLSVDELDLFKMSNDPFRHFSQKK